MIKKIDLENHFYDISSVEALQAQKTTTYPHWDKETNLIHWAENVAMHQGRVYDRLLDFADMRIKTMDKLGIEKAVISMAPGVEPLPPEYSITACRKANDALANVIKQYPDRFLGSAILPMLDTNAAMEELEHCIKDLGFVMWQTYSNYGPDLEPDQERFLPVWEKAAELNIFAYLHPTVPFITKFNEHGYIMAGPGLGFTIDAMGTITRLVLTGIFDEQPNLKVVLGHFGEALPFLLARMDDTFAWMPDPRLKNKSSFGSYWGKNIFVTNSGNASVPALECTIDAIGIDSIMLGTDYPFAPEEEAIGALESSPLTEEDKEKIYYKNAAVLGLTL